MTRTLAALTLFLSTTLTAATIPLAPRDVTADVFSQRGRLNLSAATNGSTFALVWEERLNKIYDSTASLQMRTFDANGSAEQELPRTVAGQLGPSIVWSGSDWLVVSTTAQSRFVPAPAPLRVARVDEHAAASSDATSVATGGPGRTGIVRSGDEFFLGNAGTAVITNASLQTRVTVDPGFRPLAATSTSYLAQGSGGAVVVSRDGAVLQNIATGGSNAFAAASSGSDYAIVYTTATTVEALFVSADGTITGQTTLEADNRASQPAVIRRGNQYLAGWISSPNNLCFAAFDAASKSLTHCQWTFSPIQSLAMADNGSNTMVAWSTIHDVPVPDQVFTSFTPSQQLPVVSVANAVATMLRPQFMPSLAADPNGVTAVWTDGVRPFIGGLDRATLTTRPPRGVSFEGPHITNLRLSRSNHASLVLWNRGAQIDGTLVPDDGSPVTYLTFGEGVNPQVTSDGNEWLVVWKNGAPWQLLGTIVTAHGVVVSQGGQPLMPSQYAQQSFALASRGTDFLVTWTEFRSDGGHLLALGLSPAGTPNGGEMDLAGGPIQDIRMAASGRLYLIVVSAPNIGFPVTSTVPDILVAGVPDSQFQVRPRDGGFAVMYGAPLHLRFVDALGNDADGGTLPFSAGVFDFDFVYDGTHLVLAHSMYDGNSEKTLLEVYSPRLRATGMR